MLKSARCRTERDHVLVCSGDEEIGRRVSSKTIISYTAKSSQSGRPIIDALAHGAANVERPYPANYTRLAASPNLVAQFRVALAD